MWTVIATQVRRAAIVRLPNALTVVLRFVLTVAHGVVDGHFVKYAVITM